MVSCSVVWWQLLVVVVVVAEGQHVLANYFLFEFNTNTRLAVYGFRNEIRGEHFCGVFSCTTTTTSIIK